MEITHTHAIARPVSGHPRLQTARRIALWMLIALVLLAAAAAIYLRTDAGRRFAANRIEGLVTGALPGSMQIGQLERLGWLHPVIRDLRFFDPNGKEVLHLARADVDLSVGDLLRGQLGFERVYTQGGALLINVQPDGRTGLEAAFAEPSQPGDEKGGGLRYHLRNIHVDGLHATFQVSPDQRFELRGVRGLVSVVRDATDGVRVDLQRISGSLQRKLIGAPIRLTRADGWVHGGELHVLDLALRARVGDERLNAHLAYFDREKNSVKITLKPHGIKGELGATGLEVADWLSKEVEVKTR